MNIQKDPRHAGSVLRWHAYPMLRSQTIAEHSWHVVRIVKAIHRDCSRELLLEAMFHDVGELVTGDPPSTMKRREPELSGIYRRMESSARLDMAIPWGVPPSIMLAPHEHFILKLADMIEMWEFATQEFMSGNRFALPVIGIAREYVDSALKKLVPDAGVWQAAVDYIRNREEEWRIPT